MSTQTVRRVGTTYLPVSNPAASARWFAEKLGAVTNYLDEDKAIIDLANQSFFLVKAAGEQTSNFIDHYGNQRFSLTFEVDGEEELKALRANLQELGAAVGEIEDRGHAGLNFTFSDPDGNLFDVWSVLGRG